MSTLLDDNRNSFHILARRRADGVFHNQGCFSWHGSVAQILLGKDDWYITKSGFSSKTRRQAAFCRQVGTIYVDIDMHDMPAGQLDSAKNSVLGTIAAGVMGELIPKPTFILDTGRGLALHYKLESSTSFKTVSGQVNTKGIAYYHDTERYLSDAVERIVELANLPNVVVDRSVCDDTRLFRLPGTFNSKTGTMCRILVYTPARHSLSAICKLCRPLNKPLNAGRSQRKAGAKRRFANSYSYLGELRMTRLEELQAFRGARCCGNREEMAFLYYNSAVQVYANRDDAYSRLIRFNKRFSTPLCDRELSHVRDSVDKVGYYRFSQSKIAQHLRLTDEEIDATGFFMTKRMVQRKAAKDENKARRLSRDRLIVRLKNSTNASCRQIASLVGCSASLVSLVLRKSSPKDPFPTFSTPPKRITTIEPSDVDLHTSPDALPDVLLTPLSVVDFPLGRGGLAFTGPPGCLSAS